MTGEKNVRRLTRIFIFLLVAAWTLALLRPTAAWAQAQSAGKAPIRLNLQQLIARALAVSPEMGADESDLAAARSALAQVKAAYYPRIDATAIVGPVPDAKDPIIVNDRIHDPSPGLSLSNLGVFGRLDFTVSQPLYTFGKLSNNKKAAQYGVDATKMETDKTKDEIALRVTQLYYALVLARSGISMVKDAENFFKEERNRFQRLLKLGSPNVSESDLYMIDAYRSGILQSQVQAQKGIRFATYALRAMLAIPPGTPFDVVSTSLKMQKEGNLKSLVQEAYLNRPEFKQLREALKARKYQTAAAVSDLYPSFFVALEGRLAGAPGREHFNNPYFPDQFNHADVGVVAGVKWGFDFGIKKARISEARAQYQKLLYNRKKAEMDIPIQVAQAYENIIEWRKSAKIYKKAATASRKWVVSAFADFDMGTGTADNMLRAVEKYGQNQGNYIEALFNYNMVVAKLKYATGTIRENREK